MKRVNQPDIKKPLKPSLIPRPHDSFFPNSAPKSSFLNQPISILLLLLRFLGKSVLNAIFSFARTVDFFLSHLTKFVLKTQKLKSDLLRKATKTSKVIFTTRHEIRLPGQLSLPKVRPFPSNSKLSFNTIKAVWKPALAFCFLTTLMLTSAWFYQVILKDLPVPEMLATHPQKLTTQIFDRHGILLYKIYRGQNRTLVPLSAIPLLTQQAFIAIEDKDFYRHHGLSLSGTVRAILHNLASDDIQGGSTITQQLVKNALLNPRRSIERKLKEMVLAVETELVYSKDNILQMYLNEVGFGGPVYGLQEAAQTYFDKNVSELTLAESALLAGLPKAPTKFSPFGSSPQLAKDRQQLVLRQMAQQGYISAAQANAASAEELTFKSPSTSISAPHFVQYVRDFLASQLGEDVVSEGGLQVYTTLDLTIQTLAEQEIGAELNRINSINVNNGAALVTNPATGEILAMIGSKNYFDINNDGQVNLTTALRQPGSTVKPINYSSAFEQGLTPATQILDQPVVFGTGTQTYSPVNYDGRFHGLITARTALANSYNVPAVIILNQFGISQMALLGQKMGITSWNEPSRWGLSLTLGGVEVSMIDLAQAYSTFANLGRSMPLKAVSAVYNSQGQIVSVDPCLHKKTLGSCQSREVIKPSTAYIINNILSDPQARAGAFGFNSILNVPGQQVAAKTGTSNNFRDNWTIGYTSSLLVAAWVGNNDNTPMSRVASGITGASPIWNHVISQLLATQPAHKFPTPVEIVSVPICVATGTLSCDGCPQTKIEIFSRGTEPTNHCLGSQFSESQALGKPESKNRISSYQINLN